MTTAHEALLSMDAAEEDPDPIAVVASRASRRPAAVGSRRASVAALRTLMTGGSIAVVIAVVLVAEPSASLRADPQLATLLRGMAVIKALLATAALALATWRVGHPLGRRTTIGYLVGVWLTVGAAAAIWQLAAIVPAAIAFHAGGLLLLVVAWRDDGVARSWRGSRTASSPIGSGRRHI